MDTADTHPHHRRINYVTAEIFESPKEIADMQFAVENKARGEEWLAKLLAEPDHVVAGEFSGVQIHHAANYFFTEKDGALSYFVRHEDRAFPRSTRRYVTQIAVERNRLLTPPGLPSHVFWSFLMPMHGAVMTDNAQTRLGKTFWRDQIYTALAKGAGVFFVDVAKFTARKVRNHSEAESTIHDAYGRLDRHRDLRLLITTEQLPAVFDLVEAMRAGRIAVACAST